MKQLKPAGRQARHALWCGLLSAPALQAGPAAQAQVEATAAPLAKNSGAHAATGGWWWLHRKTASTIDSCTAQNRRLIDIDIDSCTVGGSKH